MMRIANRLTAATVLVGLSAGILAGCPGREEAPQVNRSQPADSPAAAPADAQTALFAAGCFWGVEDAFRQVEGVTATEVGYCGGHTDRPTYEQVCSDRTGHAETVRVTFDPARVTYRQLLDIFWRRHDPTQHNRQGPDFGSQYRSIVFYGSPQQQAEAEASKRELERSGRFSRPIATSIEPAATFWRAEEYHQHYVAKHGRGVCASTLRD